MTPFYAEGGGQVGDKGYLESPNGDVTYIIDTKRENNVAIHIVSELPNNLLDTFSAVVDENKDLELNAIIPQLIYYIRP